ncbi:peptidyl-prolyl cis-trans isomerase [Bacillus sp. H-16]|uniref:peptidyl-prolyl cis-trans isomerase n=1 Tax=Alteribacter salitolerans TaxID=2912333 RepID=UPI0019635C6C|nr:peptidyl-prolyl cis-trans isomerase [Alteribacter salitolerans]MBM7095918.1 peptidyl-prolyl cis-trans isomerase [Alteribacter salitolerans]
MSQQEMIVTITGKTKHTITLDPGAFMFDKRKVNMDEYLQAEPSVYEETKDEDNRSALAWDSHRSGMKIRNENDINVDRNALKSQSFGIPLTPFLENASPSQEAETIVFEKQDGSEVEVPYETHKTTILKFSHKGGPLKETGPVHVYDGTNNENPYTHVVKIVVR